MNIGGFLLALLFSGMSGLGMGFNMMVMLSALEKWDISWPLVAGTGIAYMIVMLGISRPYACGRRVIRIGSRGLGVAFFLCPVATFMHGVFFPVMDPIFPMWLWAIAAAYLCWPLAITFLRKHRD